MPDFQLIDKVNRLTDRVKNIEDLINKPVTTTNEQPKILANQAALNLLHEEALKAEGDHPAYREGYLDAYNRAKLLTRLIV